MVSVSGGVGIDSESESEDGLSSSSVEIVGTEVDKGGSSAFPPSPAFATMSRGNGGTGGRICEVSIGGGGGAKGGKFNENGTVRTCRKMAEAYAGQMAENRFHIAMSLSAERTKWIVWSKRHTCRPRVYKSSFEYRII